MTGEWFLIGIAAQMAGMHPQTLRVYERRGLVQPSRSAGNTRRYSPDDVALLRRIQQLSDEGLNLAGVERVLDLEKRLARAEERARRAERRLTDEREWARHEIAQARKAGKAELVRVVKMTTALVPIAPRDSRGETFR